MRDDPKFRLGELVCVVDAGGTPIGATIIARALKSRVVTSCGRRWTRDGRHLCTRWVPPSRRQKLSIRRPYQSELRHGADV